MRNTAQVRDVYTSQFSPLSMLEQASCLLFEFVNKVNSLYPNQCLLGYDTAAPKRDRYRTAEFCFGCRTLMAIPLTGSADQDRKF